MTDKIEKILKEFDFEKVHKTMKILDWTWFEKGVPSYGSLILCAKELLERSAKEEPDFSISTGGFKASIKSDKSLKLEFILTESIVYETEDE